MAKKLAAAPLQEPKPGNVATEVRLFVYGDNPTEKGVFVMTPFDAKKTFDAWVARGTDLSWDYSHDEANPMISGPRLAAGWCKLDVRRDGLWATGIEWTDLALSLLTTRQIRYFSPFFDHDEDGHISNIINVALTNIPATHGIQPIAASAQSKTSSAWGRLCEVPRAKSPQTLGAIPPSEKKTMGKSKAEMMAELTSKMEECKAGLKLLDSMSDDDGAEGESASAADASDDDGETAAAAPPPAQKDSTIPPPPAKSSKASARLSLADLVAELVGDDDPTKAKAELLAMAQSKQTVAKLSAEVDALKSDARRAKVEGLVSQGKRDGKIEPALEKWATKLGMSDLGALESYLSNAPKKVATTTDAKHPAGVAGSPQTLSNLEHKIAVATGITPEQFLAGKTRLAANPPPVGVSEED